jgi:probable addiction module antidote protein
MTLNIDKINRRRIELDITMEELADKVGFTRPGLYKALKNKDKITLDTITKIAKALGLEAKDLLT